MIPRILHQTWKDAAIPAAFAGYVEGWKRLHPGWDFRLWTDVDLAEFVESRCAAHRELFHAYAKPVMRADLGRYLLLREFGGVYADIDCEALANVEPLLMSEAPLFAFEPDSHAALEFVRSRDFRSIVSNAVILSPPGHPFWDHLLELIHRCRSADNPLDATGPFVLTAAVERAPPAVAPRLLPAHVFSPIDKFGACVDAGESSIQTMVAHRWAGTWWKSDLAGASAEQPASQVTGLEFALSTAAAERYLNSIDRTVLDAKRPKNGRVLIAIPVRDAADTLDSLFEQLLALRYPRTDLSLAFIEGDSADDSFERLQAFAHRHVNTFRRIEVIKRDSGTVMPTPRWAPAMQRARRSHIARVRNDLVRDALQDEDWLLWIDADIIAFPDDILDTLLSADARIVHPNAVRVGQRVSMDLNAFVTERRLPARAVAPWIKAGLYEPPMGFHRLYLSDLRYRDVVPLQGVGGTMLLVDADLHRAGLLFPEEPYKFLIETEAFGAAANDISIMPIGLPNVEIVHSAR